VNLRDQRIALHIHAIDEADAVLVIAAKTGRCIDLARPSDNPSADRYPARKQK
jgi:hypothetical protein